MKKFSMEQARWIIRLRRLRSSLLKAKTQAQADAILLEIRKLEHLIITSGGKIKP